MDLITTLQAQRAAFNAELPVSVAARKDRLTVTGPFAAAAGSGDANLVSRAVAAFRTRWPDHVPFGLDLQLHKNLPVAAGLGGSRAPGRRFLASAHVVSDKL